MACNNDYLQDVFYPASVCLSVRVLAASRKNYWLELHKNFTRDPSVDKEELTEFWKLSESKSAYRKFWKDSSTLPDRGILPQFG